MFAIVFDTYQKSIQLLNFIIFNTKDIRQVPDTLFLDDKNEGHKIETSDFNSEY
jgi:hypothetical protein